MIGPIKNLKKCKISGVLRHFSLCLFALTNSSLPIPYFQGGKVFDTRPTGGSGKGGIVRELGKWSKWMAVGWLVGSLPKCLTSLLAANFTQKTWQEAKVLPLWSRWGIPWRRPTSKDLSIQSKDGIPTSRSVFRNKWDMPHWELSLGEVFKQWGQALPFLTKQSKATKQSNQLTAHS